MLTLKISVYAIFLNLCPRFSRRSRLFSDLTNSQLSSLANLTYSLRYFISAVPDVRYVSSFVLQNVFNAILTSALLLGTPRCSFLRSFHINLVIMYHLLFMRGMFSPCYCPLSCSVLLTYLLTLWCRVLLEKLTGLQLVK